MVRKLQVAVSGLGRMGARHALHFLGKTVSSIALPINNPLLTRSFPHLATSRIGGSM